jgi:hypothetical protein
MPRKREPPLAPLTWKGRDDFFSGNANGYCVGGESFSFRMIGRNENIRRPFHASMLLTTG